MRWELVIEGQSAAVRRLYRSRRLAESHAAGARSQGRTATVHPYQEGFRKPREAHRRLTHGPWNTLPDPTSIAREVWEYLYDEPWPVGWRVAWVGFMRGAGGLCSYSTGRILLSYGDARRRTGVPLAILVHEFVHLRGFVRHNAEFYQAEQRALDRLGLLPTRKEDS